MTLQHPMLRTEVPLAEPTIPNDQLRLLLAIAEVALRLFGCAAEERQDDVDDARGGDGEGGECGGCGEMVPGVHEAEFAGGVG